MNRNRYCKHCGSVVEVQYLDEERTIHICPTCNRNLKHTEVITGYKRNARIKQLKAMHELMVQANDEGIYMSWIYTMPDEPSEEDFADIAINDEMYNECFDAFVRLIAKKGNRW